jgi:hypothetical protein
MTQRVDYSVFPGVREDAYVATINKIIGHIRRSQLTARDFREWMKDEGLWLKEEAPHLLSFLDIHTEGQVHLGPFAERFFAAPDEDVARELLYKRMVDENTLLMKYALEALDTEGGGRLHSTNELHRMLTSYVYPGKQVGLVQFQNWIKWIVASGRVKLIGIRWGLTDLGKQAVPRLRALDADEFLEDEAADAAAPQVPVAAAVPAPPPPAAVPVAAPAPVSAAKAKAPKPAAAQAEDPDSEDFLDLPPESEPVDESVFTKYEHQFDEVPPTSAVPEAAPRPSSKRAAPAPAPAPAVVTAAADAPAAVIRQPRHTTPPATVARQMQTEAACTGQPLDVGDIVAALRNHARSNGIVGGGSLLLAHGLESRMAQSEAARHLLLASLLARLYAVRPDGSLAELLVERVGGLGPVAVLLDRPEALAEVIVRWGLAQGDPSSTALRSALLETVLGGRALKAQADLPTALAEAPSSEVLLGMLGQGLMRAAPLPAHFWLVREMVRAGLWTRQSATEIAFVPSRPVRLMAYRLRMIDSHFAQGAAMMLQVARRMCTLLPPGSVEAMAFEALAPSDHLRFDCVRVPICQQPCSLAPTHGEQAV